MECEYCHKVSDELPYKCKFCGGTFCSDHRLPENHECLGLEKFKDAKHEEFRGGVVKAAKDYDAKVKAYAGGGMDTRKLALYIVILIIIAFIAYYILKHV
ncbi:hypothetical protein H0N99_02210 [Candidatus Micrarchaeota archaeon]|nr:hypothetical protein [Candidatus Micrarchaeota archaeon]